MTGGREPDINDAYRGRIAPTPTGYLHLGHARTFLMAQERAGMYNGVIVLRNEDLDIQRCKREYVDAMFTDLKWAGLSWTEGPDMGGSYGPYNQSERMGEYLKVWHQLSERGYIYPCDKSRKDVAEAVRAPHNDGDEAIFPREWRPAIGVGQGAEQPDGWNWRFRVPDGEVVVFEDRRVGSCRFVAGEDFGDFVVWRRDGGPAYELAVVADDAQMGITEVVRGEDLLKSTARQLLLYRALGWSSPAWYHCSLICDGKGKRLAKRHDALSLRQIREEGISIEGALKKRVELTQ